MKWAMTHLQAVQAAERVCRALPLVTITLYPVHRPYWWLVVRGSSQFPECDVNLATEEEVQAFIIDELTCQGLPC